MASPTPERTSELRYPVGPLPCGYARAAWRAVKVSGSGRTGSRVYPGFGGYRSPPEPSGIAGNF
jgi:hypothetical protein